MFPVLALILWLACVPAWGQAVYKCTVDGKTAYGDTPCNGAPSVELAVPSAPQPDPASQHELERQGRLLANLQEQRARRELAAARARERANRAAATQERRCAKLRLRLRWLEEDGSRATGKQRDAFNVKTQRHRQEMALECPA